MTKAQRIEDLQLIVKQTLERLQGLQRYRFDAAWSAGASIGRMRKDSKGDWIDFDEMLEAIEHLRRVMGDSVLGEEMTNDKSP